MTVKIGSIFKFVSNKVKQVDAKPKYHVAIQIEKGAFLFINSNCFDGSFLIDKNSWAEIPNEFSFIACNGLIRYSKSDLKGIEIEKAGQLTDDCLLQLRDHISKTEVLETRELNYILGVLDDYLKAE